MIPIRGYATFDPLKHCWIGSGFQTEWFSDLDIYKNKKIMDPLKRIAEETEEDYLALEKILQDAGVKTYRSFLENQVGIADKFNAQMEKLKEKINKGAHNLIYPFDQIPSPGKMLKVADGVYWVRMSLPFALNHINLWVLEDGDEWVIVDTGVASAEIKSNWRKCFSEDMESRKVNKVIKPLISILNFNFLLKNTFKKRHSKMHKNKYI